MITKEMTIEEIVERYPETISPMQKLGVKCIVCGEPVWGTLEENVLEKGLNLEEIIFKLNQVTQEAAEEK
ncbi:MAG: DUF1858 domain-containing protein [Calditrichaceae bacterium]